MERYGTIIDGIMTPAPRAIHIGGAEGTSVTYGPDA